VVARPSLLKLLHIGLQGGPKGMPQTLVHIFAKCRPIVNIFAPAHSVESL